MSEAKEEISAFCMGLTIGLIVSGLIACFTFRWGKAEAIIEAHDKPAEMKGTEK